MLTFILILQTNSDYEPLQKELGNKVLCKILVCSGFGFCWLCHAFI